LRGDPLTRGFLIVCPQRDEPGRWTPNDAEGVHALLNSAIAEHRGDENRIYLTGFSYGGDAVLRFPTYSGGDRFQKLWAVDPAVDNETPALPANRPLLIHYGVHFPQMTSFLDDWKSRGKPGEVRLKDTDFEHVATCRAAYADSEAYKWLEERG
jgi:dienelactone hydrolase